MFLYSHWMGLSLPTRALIAHHFGIAKTGPTHVQDNVVISDGYRIIDVENALSIENIQNFTGSTSKDMQELWATLINKVNGVQEAPVISEPEAPKVEKAVKKPAKKSK